MNPMISIVMPVHNSERFIKTTLESLLGQTFENFELIIVDDHSIDNTKSIIEDFSDQRISIFDNPGRGAISAYNEGISRASSEFISIMDHDDIADKTRLQKQFEILSNSDIDVVGCYYKVIDEEGKVINNVRLPVMDFEIKDAGLYSCSVNNSGCMVKKSIFEKHGLFNAEAYPSHDFELWLRIRDSAKFHNIPEYLQSWRSVSTSPSQLQFDQQRDIALKFSNEYLDKQRSKFEKGEYEFLVGRNYYYLESPRHSIKWFLKAIVKGYLKVTVLRFAFFSIFGFFFIKIYRDYLIKNNFLKKYKHEF